MRIIPGSISEVIVAVDVIQVLVGESFERVAGLVLVLVQVVAYVRDGDRAAREGRILAYTWPKGWVFRDFLELLRRHEVLNVDNFVLPLLEL